MSRFSRQKALPLPQITSQDEKIIIFLGVTGSGKSSFISALTNQKEVGVGHGLCSTTETVHTYHTTIDSTKFMLVDTPGFNDTFRDDKEVLKEITDWLASTYQRGKKITGVIYLHPINQPRMEGTALLSLTVMQKLCGSDTFENVVLASTFWDLVDEPAGLKRENELCRTPQFWGGMKRNGSKVVRITDYAQSKDILLQLARKSKVALQVQIEMVEDKKQLSDTAAAQKLDQECIRQQEEHEQQKKIIEERAKAELKAREEQNKRKLAEQLERQQAAHHLQKQLVEDRQRAEERLQQAKLEEKNRIAREARLAAEKERRRLKAIQEQKDKLAREQREVEAAQREQEAKEKRRREIIAKKVLAARYRAELKMQRQNFFDALSRRTVWAYTFSFEEQSPDFINWCDRCFDLIRFGGYRQCYTCVLQICETCWESGDRCGDDNQNHRVVSTPRRPRPSTCCIRLQHRAESVRCDRVGCGKLVRGLHFHCCFCYNGDCDICLECVISGFTCPGNHRLHQTINWPQQTVLPYG